jgi:outer membrane lipoprotein-sorting protein
MSQCNFRILGPVNPRTILQRHRALRWLAPVGVVGIAAIAATGMFREPAKPTTLPDTSPASLIAAVQTSQPTGFSGTVVSTLALGLPELPAIGNAGQGSSLSALLTGSHTMQVWSGGPTKERVALLGATEETDVFRNGRSVWQWSSAEHRAVHLTLPATAAHQSAPASSGNSISPPVLAKRALAALDPTTTVRVEHGGTVADRSTYELILTPRSAQTRVGSVHIDVDGATKLPLAVRVFARGSSTAAVDVAFTSIRFVDPPARNFTFTPPPGAKIETIRPQHRALTTPAGKGGTKVARKITGYGSGWTRVFATTLSKSAAASVQRSPVRDSLTPVTGSWGKGRLLQSDLLSVLLTDDGRVFAGSVDPDALYAAASK